MTIDIANRVIRARGSHSAAGDGSGGGAAHAL